MPEVIAEFYLGRRLFEGLAALINHTPIYPGMSALLGMRYDIGMVRPAGAQEIIKQRGYGHHQWLAGRHVELTIKPDGWIDASGYDLLYDAGTAQQVLEAATIELSPSYLAPGRTITVELTGWKKVKKDPDSELADHLQPVLSVQVSYTGSAKSATVFLGVTGKGNFKSYCILGGDLEDVVCQAISNAINAPKTRAKIIGYENKEDETPLETFTGTYVIPGPEIINEMPSFGRDSYWRFDRILGLIDAKPDTEFPTEDLDSVILDFWASFGLIPEWQKLHTEKVWLEARRDPAKAQAFEAARLQYMLELATRIKLSAGS